MSKLIEPLKQEPSVAKEGGSYAAHYTQGFHDGAYALAQELLDRASLGGRIYNALQDYATKFARPCKGWAHEPCKPQPKATGEETLFNRPGRWDELGGVWVEEGLK